MEIIEEAIIFATLAHSGQKRKDGTPYIFHPLSVATYIKDKGYSEDYILTALFHDLLEDTDVTEEEILERSSKQVLKAVKLLTKTEDNSRTYLKDISKDPIASVVKVADRIHNLNEAANGGDINFVGRYLENTTQYFRYFSDPELEKAYNKLYGYYIQNI